jgi:hypothetical protein
MADPIFGSSSLLDVSLVDRTSTGLWSLSRLGMTLEQEQIQRQKQDYYLNYGRALRVIREDIPRWARHNYLKKASKTAKHILVCSGVKRDSRFRAPVPRMPVNILTFVVVEGVRSSACLGRA